MKAIKEVGWKKVFKYFFYSFFYCIFKRLMFPPFRVLALKLMGAKIGKNCIIHDINFFNYYRTGFKGITIGDDCFLGEECLWDLAGEIVLENQVTIAEGVMLLTHLNVGYKDHPLQSEFPATEGSIRIQSGSFIGSRSTILSGVVVATKTFVGAHTLVNKTVGPNQLVVGVPGRVVREW